MCIEIQAVNYDYCEHDIYDKYMIITETDDLHYNIIDRIRNENIIICKNDFEAYMYDVYVDLIDHLENDEYVNNATIGCDVYYHKGPLPHSLYGTSEASKQNFSSVSYNIDLDEDEDVQTKTTAKFIKHILRKMKLCSKVKELVSY